MPPIISIVGRSNSGKTTLLEKLIAELTTRGYRIATVKHTHGSMAYPESDKDSDRHLKAGSAVALVTSPGGLVLTKKYEQELTLDQVALIIGEDYDLILTEGFKEADTPKIEVHRKANAPPLTGVTKIFAYATDEPLANTTRQFGLDDVQPIADLIEEGFIKPHLARFSLLVNDTPIPLNTFTKDYIVNIQLAMAQGLKGVDQIRTLKIFLKKE
jgi:molybdopterin-guanine dinucleotide biosynthesis protein B